MTTQQAVDDTVVRHDPTGLSIIQPTDTNARLALARLDAAVDHADAMAALYESDNFR